MKTFEEILRPLMKEEVLMSVVDMHTEDDFWDLIIRYIKPKLKEVHDQAVDLCLENVKLMAHDSNTGLFEFKDKFNEDTALRVYIDRESILKVKDFYNIELWQKEDEQK